MPRRAYPRDPRRQKPDYGHRLPQYRQRRRLGTGAGVSILLPRIFGEARLPAWNQHHLLRDDSLSRVATSFGAVAAEVTRLQYLRESRVGGAIVSVVTSAATFRCVGRSTDLRKRLPRERDGHGDQSSRFKVQRSKFGAVADCRRRLRLPLGL